MDKFELAYCTLSFSTGKLSSPYFFFVNIEISLAIPIRKWLVLHLVCSQLAGLLFTFASKYTKYILEQPLVIFIFIFLIFISYSRKRFFKIGINSSNSTDEIVTPCIKLYKVTLTRCPKFWETSHSTIKNPEHIFQLCLTITKITINGLLQLNFESETIVIFLLFLSTCAHNWKICCIFYGLVFGKIIQGGLVTNMFILKKTGL